jgi:hypothetical protein
MVVLGRSVLCVLMVCVRTLYDAHSVTEGYIPSKTELAVAYQRPNRQGEMLTNVQTKRSQVWFS